MGGRTTAVRRIGVTDELPVVIYLHHYRWGVVHAEVDNAERDVTGANMITHTERTGPEGEPVGARSE